METEFYPHQVITYWDRNSKRMMDLDLNEVSGIGSVVISAQNSSVTYAIFLKGTDGVNVTFHARKNYHSKDVEAIDTLEKVRAMVEREHEILRYLWLNRPSQEDRDAYLLERDYLT